MGVATNIEWCDHTFNPWIGCAKVHAGCTHCYAEQQMDRRLHRVQWGPHGTRAVASESTWRGPVKWNRESQVDGLRSRVFCASVADIFEDWTGPLVRFGRSSRLVHTLHGWQEETTDQHESCSGVTLDDVRDRLFGLIDSTKNLDWLLLTKRPENARRMIADYIARSRLRRSYHFGRSVWIGCSVSDQETADRLLPELQPPHELARVRFASIEPLLGPIDLAQHLHHLDWVIVGGESGPHARPCRFEWIEAIVAQCAERHVPCFVKQLGANVEIDLTRVDDGFPEGTVAEPCRVADDGERLFGRAQLKDRKGGSPSEWPAHLRVREFPRAW